jgi:hypothetical protein
MGVSIHYGRGEDASAVVPLAGQSEIDQLWMPIIQKCGLVLLEVCMTAGLAVDAENYSQVLEEITTIQKEIEETISYVDDPTNPAFRCRRLHDIVSTHPPGKGFSVYVG